MTQVSTRRTVLGYKSIKSLARSLKVTEEELYSIAELCDMSYPYKSWKEPKRSGKGYRLIENPHSPLKRVLKKINHLLQRIALTDIFHGCYKATHVKTNAAPHLRSSHLEQIDLTNYYYNIHHSQVYAGLLALDCSPSVARLLARLTTINGHVPQGAPTSPIIAVVALLSTSRRLAALCRKIHAKITIYGDNICLSGPSHTRHYSSTILGIVRQSGFQSRAGKRISCNRDEIWELPGLEVRRGKIDVQQVEFLRLRDMLVRCAQLGESRLAHKVCNRFEAKVEGLVYHHRWIGTTYDKKLTRRASILGSV